MSTPPSTPSDTSRVVAGERGPGAENASWSDSERRVERDRGREVVKIEALLIAAGQSAHLVLEGSDSPWRQGVRFVTEGVLRVAGVEAPQLDIWTDTAPPSVEISCVETDGLLRFYNIWQSGRRPGVESRSATSGDARRGS
jgi:hypothetical protein